ncbi:MAG TPA: hypothetical protein PKE64_30410 [Anaerolineae bacterium]|nr:hypothetical protein [Anaerolineae bacterium]
MDVLTIIIIIALMAAAIWLVALPLLEQKAPPLEQSPEPASQSLIELQARYQALLNAIHDLTFDYEMGKVTAEDYEPLLNKTKLEAAQLRQRLDQLSQPLSPEEAAGLEADVEALVAQLRQKPVEDTALKREVEAEIEALKMRRPAAAAQPTCPQCSSPYHLGDTFCARCGASLSETTPPPRWEEVRA